jgi:integrase
MAQMMQSYHSRWYIDSSQILSRNEIALVLDDLKRKGRRSVNSRLNMIIFRLAVCCGCRASEIGGLKLQDVKLTIDKPYLYLSKAIAKGRKARKVPLWWDRGNLEDLIQWKAERQRQGAQAGDYFVCAQYAHKHGNKLGRDGIRNRFLTACKVLGKERLILGRDTFSEQSGKCGQFYYKHLTLHCGRHTFCSHALAGGRSLAEVKAAAGHSSIATTSIYTHVAREDDGAVGDLFDFAEVG